MSLFERRTIRADNLLHPRRKIMHLKREACAVYHRHGVMTGYSNKQQLGFDGKAGMMTTIDTFASFYLPNTLSLRHYWPRNAAMTFPEERYLHDARSLSRAQPGDVPMILGFLSPKFNCLELFPGGQDDTHIDFEITSTWSVKAEDNLYQAMVAMLLELKNHMANFQEILKHHRHGAPSEIDSTDLTPT